MCRYFIFTAFTATSFAVVWVVTWLQNVPEERAFKWVVALIWQVTLCTFSHTTSPPVYLPLWLSLTLLPGALTAPTLEAGRLYGLRTKRTSQASQPPFPTLYPSSFLSTVLLYKYLVFRHTHAVSMLKSGKGLTPPSFCRPVSLLDTVGRPLLTGVLTELDEQRRLSEDQIGFRTKLSRLCNRAVLLTESTATLPRSAWPGRFLCMWIKPAAPCRPKVSFIMELVEVCVQQRGWLQC